MSSVSLTAPDGIGEVEEGCDLVGLVLAAADLAEGDIVVLTSKVLSKAEGRVLLGADREEAITAQTVRTVAARGPVRIVENHLGLVMAAAGVDNSNLPVGTIALLPHDPDDSARRLRDGLFRDAGLNVGVVISDTSGRAWRLGQTDIAIGAAGITPLDSFAGSTDGYGNPLAVTEPAVVDEIASAAELASGKLGSRPLVVVRGLADRVLPHGEHGPGAAAVIRPRTSDMFALGTRESVLAALLGESDAFGVPAGAAEVRSALELIGVRSQGDPGDDGDQLLLGPLDPRTTVRVELLVLAHAWSLDRMPTGYLLRPGRRDPVT